MEIGPYADFRKEVVKEEDFFVDKLFLRSITTRVSWLLLRTLGTINPNLVTAVGLVAGIVGCLLIVFNVAAATVAGISCLSLWIITDRIDGEIARYTSQTSIHGAFLDNVTDNLIVPSIVLAATFSTYWTVTEWYVFALGSVASLSIVFCRLLFGLRAENLLKNDLVDHPREAVSRLNDSSITPAVRVGLFFVRLYDSFKRGYTVFFMFSVALVIDLLIEPVYLFGMEITITLFLIIVYMSMTIFLFINLIGIYKTLPTK